MYKLCGNRINYDLCNAIIDADDSNSLCVSCRLNGKIPDLTKPGNLLAWAKLEQAKRRLIVGLIRIKLPLIAPAATYPVGLRFNFLEDQRSNPDVYEEFVTTGHHNGVITINILEANDRHITEQKEYSRERYRTILGHMRHEVGHYYFELLNSKKDEFGRIFGDPNIFYQEALSRYYANGPVSDWNNKYISAYASSHPYEDWAECFAHYLHIIDTIDTASYRDMNIPRVDQLSIEDMLENWNRLSVTLNELNRSLGLEDAYPFVISPPVSEKLSLIHHQINNYA
jgi:hypothetical protein